MVKKLSIFFLNIVVLTGLAGCAPCTVCQNYPHHYWPRFANYQIATQPFAPKNTIKVVSYNIHHSQKITEAAELLKTDPELKKADFILLQEMNSNAIETLAKKLKYNYVYYPSAVHQAFHNEFGNAVLSIWPIKEDKKIVLKGDIDERLQRNAVGIIAMVGNKKVHLYSTHLGVFTHSRQRKKQIEVIFGELKPSPDHVIIAGDFNTYTRKNLRVVNNTFSSAGYTWATADIGWTHIQELLLFKRLTLDQIYCKGFQVLKSGKVPSPTVSDHLPIWADLQFD